MTVFVLIVTVIAMSVLCVVYDKEKSNSILLMLCETGATNLDYYFNGVQKSVKRFRPLRKRMLRSLMTKNLTRMWNASGTILVTS